MKVGLLIEKMRSRLIKHYPVDVFTKEVMENIRKIKKICNDDYSNQSFYGAAALNRKILLDQRIAGLLTPETILAIMIIHSNRQPPHSKNNITIYRNSSGNTSLAAVLFYGFNDGLETIRLMPNNEPHYNSKLYDKQKKQYAVHTKNIVTNVVRAAQLIGINAKDKQFQHNKIKEEKSLIEVYDRFVNVIEKIKKDGRSNQLLYVPGYSANNIREQGVAGFIAICKALKIKFETNANHTIVILPPVTLETIIKKFLSSEETLLHGSVIHLFYDRAHLEACIEQDTKIMIENNEYRFKDILRKMVIQCEKSTDFVHTTAKEQFGIRLKLVEIHLKQNFLSYYQAKEEKDKKESEHPVQQDNIPFGVKESKRIIRLFDEFFKKEIWSLNNSNDEHEAKYFLQKVVEYYDKAKSKLPLQKCMILAKWQNRIGYDYMVRTYGIKFLSIFLTDIIPDYLITQGPRIKSQASIALEKVVHLLLSTYKSIECTFNSLDELEITIDGEVFNITQILDHDPDFEHIALTDEQLEKYSRLFLQQTGEAKTAEEYKQNDPKNECAHLHYGEKLAITLYTSDFYTTMQSFLRSSARDINVTNRLSLCQLRQTVPKILLGVVVAAHGLTKSTIKASTMNGISQRTSYRGEQIPDAPSANFFKQRVEAIKNRKSLHESGFVSTTVNKNLYNNYNVFTTYYEDAYSDTFRKNVQVISMVRGEEEVLYPPGMQFQYLDHMKIEERDFFSVKPIRSIGGIKPDNYSPLFRARHELEIVDKALEMHIKTHKHGFIRKLFDTVSNDKKIACVQSAKNKIKEILDKIDDPEKLSLESLEVCKQALIIAIYRNTDLVYNATFIASLGKTNEILQQALRRINHAIQLTNNHIVTHENETITTVKIT